MDPAGWKTIYFLGIGGIGMSALARYFHQRGAAVSGYDKTRTTLTRQLEGEGMVIRYSEDPGSLPANIDIVIITPAIPADHAEWKHFRETGVPILKRSEVLGLLSEGYRTMAIGGTHGKTTTSSLTAWLLKSGGVDCTAFLGGIAANFDGNYLGGESDWMVVEADEFDRSFLRLNPEIAVVLSMDPDHLDIYGEGEAVRNAYVQFLDRTISGGLILVEESVHQSLSSAEKDLLNSRDRRLESYGIGGDTVSAGNIRVENGLFHFMYNSPDSTLEMMLPLPGRHNVKNALVAIRLAELAGVPLDVIKEKLALFKGIKRRFEWIYRSDRTVYIDDYAHHPTELAAAIGAARELFPGRQLTGIFQPHLFSRTRDFMEGFARELSKLDTVVLLDIYPAREKPIPGITSRVLFDRIDVGDKWLMSRDEVPEWLSGRSVDVLMTLGAGDIDVLVPRIKALLEDAERQG